MVIIPSIVWNCFYIRNSELPEKVLEFTEFITVELQ